MKIHVYYNPNIYEDNYVVEDVDRGVKAGEISRDSLASILTEKEYLLFISGERSTFVLSKKRSARLPF